MRKKALYTTIIVQYFDEYKQKNGSAEVSSELATYILATACPLIFAWYSQGLKNPSARGFYFLE